MSSPRRSSPLPAVVCATGVALALLLSGCAADGAAQAVVATPTPSVTASPAPPAVPARPAPVTTGPADPLTGTRPASTAALVALKVDNSPFARPYHRGLDRASIVYQELMEGGSTRFLALLDGADTREVGPIRSVRESDLDLLRPFGKVAVGFSGGNSGVKRQVATAVRAGRLLDASYDALPSSYRLGEQRRDARNFFTVPATLAARRPAAARPQPVGLTFGPLAAGTTAATVTRARISFSDISRVDVRYDAPSRRWAVWQDGTRMRGVAPSNVVVQRVSVRSSAYSDINGQNSPRTVSTGSGVVTVLRDGRAVTGTWRRMGTDNGARLLDAKGRDIALRPGPTWILLLPQGRSLSTG